MQCYSHWPLRHSHDIFGTSRAKTAKSPHRFLEVLIYRHRRHAALTRAVNISVGKSESAVPTGKAYTYSSSPQLLIDAVRRIKIINVRPSPEFGLISLLFVLSMAIGAIVSLVIIAIPAMFSMRRLAASMDKLYEVVSKEVPGTLLSLKLSGLEIKDLTQQLSFLRKRISASPRAKKEKKQ